MCADLINLENDIEILKNNGVEYLHVDFMDNKFVSNITFGADTVRALKDVCGMHRDIHVMAQNPVQYFDKMDVGETDIVAVHYESCLENTENVLKDIHSRGALAFLAISPDTSVKTARKFFEHIDGVLLMSVYPGFAGRPMVPGSFERISELRKYIDEYGNTLHFNHQYRYSVTVNGENTVVNKTFKDEVYLPFVQSRLHRLLLSHS